MENFNIIVIELYFGRKIFQSIFQKILKEKIMTAGSA